MKRKMKWILIENIMGHKYKDENRRKKYPNEKKNLNPQTITTYFSGN